MSNEQIKQQEKLLKQAELEVIEFIHNGDYGSAVARLFDMEWRKGIIYLLRRRGVNV